MFFILIHLIGYTSTFILASAFISVGIEKGYLSLRWKKHEKCLENIVRLERELGLGVSAFTRDFIAEKLDGPIKFPVGSVSKDFAINDYNGAVEVICRNCAKKYKPGDEYDNYYASKSYNKRDMQKLCKTCLPFLEEAREYDRATTEYSD